MSTKEEIWLAKHEALAAEQTEIWLAKHEALHAHYLATAKRRSEWDRSADYVINLLKGSR